MKAILSLIIITFSQITFAIDNSKEADQIKKIINHCNINTVKVIPHNKSFFKTNSFNH